MLIKFKNGRFSAVEVDVLSDWEKLLGYIHRNANGSAGMKKALARECAGLGGC